MDDARDVPCDAVIGRERELTVLHGLLSADALLNALRLLADAGPVVVAIDDVHWLDAPSAGMIAFVARRAPADRVRFLLTLRLRCKAADCGHVA